MNNQSNTSRAKTLPRPQGQSQARPQASARAQVAVTPSRVIPVTDCQVYPLQNPSRTVGFATITLGGQFVVKDLRLIDGSNGLFVAMPQKKVTTNEGDVWKDTCLPITKEQRDEIQNAVLSAWNNAVSGGHLPE